MHSSELEGIGPLTVAVTSVLGEQDRGDLTELTPPAPPRVWRYRRLVALAVAAWLAPLAWLVGRRLARRGKLPAPERAPGTIDDALPSLVAAALDGRITTEEQARLEWLLLADWCERLGLSEASPRDALRRLREHAEAGPLVVQLEAWLHRPGGRLPAELCQHLAPYLCEVAP